MKEVVKCVIPVELQRFFANPPLRINESRTIYDAVLMATIEAIDPRDAYEWLLAKDLVDLTWQIRGVAKDKADMVNATWKEALRMLLETLLDGDPQERRCVAQARAQEFFTEKGREWVVTFLADHQLTDDAIAAQAAALRLPELDIMDRQMERARLARMAIARDLLHHRVAGSWKRPDDVVAIVDARASPVPLDPPAQDARVQ